MSDFLAPTRIPKAGSAARRSEIEATRGGPGVSRSFARISGGSAARTAEQQKASENATSYHYADLSRRSQQRSAINDNPPQILTSKPEAESGCLSVAPPSAMHHSADAPPTSGRVSPRLSPQTVVNRFRTTIGGFFAFGNRPPGPNQD